MNDVELARRVAGADHASFVLLMRRNNRMLYRTARAILKDEGEAEDAVQEAYLLAYRTIGRFRGDAKLSTWLVRIVMNEAIGRLRKRTRSAAIAARLDGEADVDRAMPELPEHATQRTQQRRIVERTIDSLPDAFRTVFILRALEEMSVEEVGAALDIPEATVRTRFFRAKQLLRKALATETPPADTFAFAGARCDGIVAVVLARLGQ